MICNYAEGGPTPPPNSNQYLPGLLGISHRETYQPTEPSFAASSLSGRCGCNNPCTWRAEFSTSIFWLLQPSRKNAEDTQKWQPSIFQQSNSTSGYIRDTSGILLVLGCSWRFPKSESGHVWTSECHMSA